MPEIPNTIKIPNTPDFRPYNLWEAVSEFNSRLQSGNLENYRPTPLGFPQLDACLGGGLRSEDLALIGGMQNVGKTIGALQVARNLAVADEVLPIVVCYEHGPEALLHRLICQESIEDPDDPCPTGGVTRAEIEQAVFAYYDQHPAPEDRQKLDLDWLLQHLPGAERAWYRMRDYLWRLWLVRGDGLDTTLEYLHEYVGMAQASGFRRVLLIVDYAQRVPLRPILAGMPLDEAQRIDLIMRGLKGLGLKLGIPVLAVAAADADSLRRQRVHVENLWGPATVQYEPDVAIILNRDSLDGEEGTRIVRVAIEKNRNGPSEIEYHHRLHGAYYCLSRTGQIVSEADSFQSERIELRKKQQSARSGLDLLVAMFFLAEFMHRDKKTDGKDVMDLFRRALKAEDGGAGMLPEIAERLGLEALVEA